MATKCPTCLWPLSLWLFVYCDILYILYCTSLHMCRSVITIDTQTLCMLLSKSMHVQYITKFRNHKPSMPDSHVGVNQTTSNINSLIQSERVWLYLTVVN
ncbi:hypothetical protein MT418_002003 [Batrachochytrium dendrobatidis]